MSKNSDWRKTLYLSASLCFLFLCRTEIAVAQSGQGLTDATSRAQRDCDHLVKSLSSYLQMSGKWPPQPGSREFGLCQSMQAFQQQLGTLSRSANSQNYQLLQGQNQQLQFLAQSLESQLYQVAPNSVVLGNWNELRSDLLAVSQGLYAFNTISAGNNFFFPETNDSNSATQLTSQLSGLERSTDKLVKQLTIFLTMQRRWPPQPLSSDFQLCQTMQAFQQKIKRLEADAHGQQSYAILQGQVQQLGFNSQNLESQLTASGASPELMSQFYEVKNKLGLLYQSFYSTGGGYFWSR